VSAAARSSRKHTPKVNTKGLPKSYKDAFVKLNPRQMVKNQVMFLVWVGTIVTALLTIDPYLLVATLGESAAVQWLITVILFFTVVFANFAGRWLKGRVRLKDALRSTKSDTTARKLCPMAQFKYLQLRQGDQVKVIAGIIPGDGSDCRCRFRG